MSMDAEDQRERVRSFAGRNVVPTLLAVVILLSCLVVLLMVNNEDEAEIIRQLAAREDLLKIQEGVHAEPEMVANITINEVEPEAHHEYRADSYGKWEGGIEVIRLKRESDPQDQSQESGDKATEDDKPQMKAARARKSKSKAKPEAKPTTIKKTMPKDTTDKKAAESTTKATDGTTKATGGTTKASGGSATKAPKNNNKAPSQKDKAKPSAGSKKSADKDKKKSSAKVEDEGTKTVPTKINTPQDWVRECRTSELTATGGEVIGAYLDIVPNPRTQSNNIDDDRVVREYNFRFKIEFGDLIPAFWRIYDPYHGHGETIEKGLYGDLCGGPPGRGWNSDMQVRQGPCPLEKNVGRPFDLRIKSGVDTARLHVPARLELYGHRYNGSEFLASCLEVSHDLDRDDWKDWDRERMGFTRGTG